MNDKKSFFELLDAKGALLVGVVGGILTLGTIGFIILGILAIQGKIGLSLGSSSGSVAVLPTQIPGTNQQQGNTPPVPSVPKANRPKVELFVMSYCPYGLQMEKAYIPAWQLLKDKADIDIKFVSYAMHGHKEVEENTRQYCVQKGQKDKFVSYLSCFIASGDSASCLSKTGVNENKLASCMSQTDKQFGISAEEKDQSKWLSGQFPIFPIHKGLNDTYGVQGSPTLIINGLKAEVARTPESVKQVICAAFKNPPAECGQALSTLAFQPGFGSETSAVGGGSATPGCGT